MRKDTMKKLFLLPLLALSPLMGQAQTDVSPFVPGSTLEGVNYFLPRTALRIVVEAEKTVTSPGELNRYSYRYLREKEVPTTTSTEWRLTGIRVETYGVPDPTKAYNVKVKSKTLAPLVSLTTDGILLGINTEEEPTALAPLPEGKEAPAIRNARDYMNQEMLSAGSSAKLAELCAQEIYDLRDSRNALIRGEADNTPKDGAQLKLMLNELDLQTRTLEQLFKGTTQTSTHVFTLHVLPEEQGEQVLFRFSKHLGLLEPDNLAGEAVYMNLKALETLPQQASQEEKTNGGTSKGILFFKKKEASPKGIYYNVPVREEISIYDARTSYLKTEAPMAQFGITEVLSDILFNKGVTTKVTFYPQTGGVKKLEQ